MTPAEDGPGSSRDSGSLEETAHLLRSTENARRLTTSIERLDAGQGVRRELIE